MRLFSWNVNGFRAVLGKGFAETFNTLNPDVFCLQETKMQQGQAEFAPEGYYQYWSFAQRKGYSGTAVFTKQKPLNVQEGIGHILDNEGRALTLEFPNFYLVNVYTPNAQEGLKRIDMRLDWEDALREHLLQLDAQKPVIYCGDLNVAHNPIDLKNPGPNRGKAGFSDEEREKLTQLLDSGFADTFRVLYPEKAGAYSWWSYRFNARANNAGWRIDYFIVSARLLDNVRDSIIYPDITGSDHCPVGLILDIK